MTRGFTFIELLIVVSILVLLTGGGVVAINRFREKRVAQTDALALSERLRKVQVKAGAEVPTGCSGVKNYTVTVTTSLMTVMANCNAGGGAITDLALTLSKSHVTNAPLTIVFNSGLVSASSVSIDICDNLNRYKYRVTVSNSGNVSRPVYQGTVCP